MAEQETEAASPLEPAELAELLDRGEIDLVDVRTDHEWQAGRIPGARHLGVNEVPEAAQALSREQAVVLYCRGGSRSAFVADALRSAGFDARALAGGISAWVEQDRPLDPEDGHVAESGLAAALIQSKRKED